jgi:sec-independent protein translocase protein TatA
MSPVLAIWESPVQLIVVGVIALLLFGNRLPEVMRSLGKGITEFKKGMHGLDEDSTHSPHQSSASTYQEPARSLPVDARTELVAPKFLPPTTVPAPPQSTTPA